MIALSVDPFQQQFRDDWSERTDPRSHIAFAQTLTVPDSQDDRGNMESYDAHSHPGQFHTLTALDGGYDLPGHRFRQFVLVTGTQEGKSWILQICTFRDMVEVGQNVIYALPTRDLGGDIWSLKLRPAITGAGLERYLPTAGTGSRDGAKPRFVPFQIVDGKGGGTLVFMAAGGRGQSGQAALTAKKLAVDEVDDWPEPALHRIRRRVDKYADTAIQLFACTIKKDDSPLRENDHSNIVDLYEKSNQGRVEYQCPHCKDWTRFEWEGFKYDGTTRETWVATVGVACTKCGGKITEADRRACFGKTRYAADKPFADSWGLRLSALDCPWKSLAWLADLHCNAVADRDRGNHEPMRQFAHDQMAAQYHGDENTGDNAEEIDPGYLFRRSQASTWGPSVKDSDRPHEESSDVTYSRHIAPMPNAEFAFVSVDVQANRCYWLLMAGDKEGRTYDVAWGYEHAAADRKDMNQSELFSVLDRIDGITRQSAEQTPIILRGVDANFKTDDVLSWLRTHHEWHPVYGASAGKAMKLKGKGGIKVRDFPGIVYLRRDDEWKLRQDRVHIDTNPMRMAAQRGFLLKAGAPGAAHLPNGLANNQSDKTYLQHLCGERWNQEKMKWEKTKGRWDFLDCRVYAYALYRWHLERIRRESVKPKRNIKYGNIGTL